MLLLEEMMEIKILYSQGLSIRKIASQMGMSRNTVKKYLLGNFPKLGYVREVVQSSKLQAYYDYLQMRIASAAPEWIPKSVLFKEIKAQGYEGKETILRRYLRQFKVRPQTAIRFETPAVKQMQVDFAEFRRGKDRLSAFIATLGFSRMAYVEFVKDNKIDTLLNCLCQAFEFFSGITQQILFDNMKTVVIRRNAYGEGLHRFHAKLWDFAKHYGFVPKLCAPYRAQTKGKVERFIGYLRRSFYLPLRTILSQANLKIDKVIANNEVKKWLYEHANQRIHATTQKRPLDQWQIEKNFLLPIATQYSLKRPQSPPLAVKPQSLITLQTYCSKPLQHDLGIYQQLLY